MVKNSIKISSLIFLLLMVYSCQQPGGNTTGSEYMPDMGHSVAYEANTFGYYKWNRWGSEEDLYKMAQPRKPVAGTIARGFAGAEGLNTGGGSHQGRAYTMNGNVPYHFGDTEEERARATKEIINNPYPITDGGLATGKQLYTIYCGICHGDKGDGGGYLVRDDGKYPAQPANFTKDEFITASNGRFYHSIIYGKNVMGGYADKLSYKERWEVIHYIRSLQASSKSLVYTSQQNTLNNVDRPYASVVKLNPIVTSEAGQKPSTETAEHKADNHKESHH